MGTARPANTVTTCLASAETRRALPSLLSCCWRCLSMPLPKDTVTLPHMSILNITAVWRLSLRTLRPAHLLSLQFLKMSQCPSLRSLTRSSVMTSPGLSALNPSPWSRTRSACTAYTAIGLRGSGDHVLDEIPVARGINDGDVVVLSLELPEGNIDGDTTFTLGLELVQHPGVL